MDSVTSDQAAVDDRPIASVGSRLVAAAVDIAVLVAVFFGVGIIAMFAAAAVDDDDFVWFSIVLVAVVVASAIANLAVRQGLRGASIGKSVAHLAVVDEITGEPIGTPRGLLRLLVHMTVDVPTLIGPVLTVVDTAERRTVADRVCRSVVVSTH